MLTAHETTFWLQQREGCSRDAARSIRGRVAMSDKPVGLISLICSTRAHKRILGRHESQAKAGLSL
jgi:hypothetical protein